MSRPWMPLYVADYLADTMHLSTVEHGAYMLLIMHYWQNGSLPLEPVKLARIARMTGKEWAEISDTIAELFQDGWTHKRIDAELAEAQAKYERRAEAGRKGGQAKPSSTNAEAKPKRSLSNASSAAQAMPPEIGSNAQAYAGAARGNSQPQPQPQPQKIDSSEPQQPVGRASQAALLEDLEIKCRQAAGVENDPSPGLLVIGPIADLVEAGWSLDRHVLPALRSAHVAGRKGKTWTYYAKIITDGATSPPKAEPPPQAAAKPKLTERQLIQMARQYIERGNDWPFNSPPPGAPGTSITTEIMEQARAEVSAERQRRARPGEAA